ncbi:Glutaredoxin 2 [invertebrate metagenome]|uniref:Glutaredoxin 2 n=1 Tax=invertebrate metagenome TaxID=1711999 RepID=A0A2H9T765_9ZZZZ
MMKLFVFEHCPYCIKAMMMKGLKKLSLDFVYLQNHDVTARTEKVGANVVPILQKDDGSYMAESMDIVHYLDQLDNNPVLTAEVNAERVAEWLDQVRHWTHLLLFPRWMKIDLPEFQYQQAINWFTKNKSTMIGMSFDEAFHQSSETIERINRKFTELEKWLLLPSLRGNRLSYDDIHLFPALRNCTVIKGLVMPPVVRRYIDEVAELTDIRLFDDEAL